MTQPKDSVWDARLPSQRKELTDAIAKLLSKRGQPTSALARAVGCNHPQAVRALNRLYDEGRADYDGEKKFRVWMKA